MNKNDNEKKVTELNLGTIPGKPVIQFTIGEEKINLTPETVSTIIEKAGTAAIPAIQAAMVHLDADVQEQIREALVNWVDAQDEPEDFKGDHFVTMESPWKDIAANHLDVVGDIINPDGSLSDTHYRRLKNGLESPIDNRTMIVPEDEDKSDSMSELISLMDANLQAGRKYPNASPMLEILEELEYGGEELKRYIRDEHRRKLDKIVEQMNIVNPPRIPQPPIFHLDIGNGDKLVRHFGVLSSSDQSEWNQAQEYVKKNLHFGVLSTPTSSPQVNIQGLGRLKKRATFEERLNNKRKGTRMRTAITYPSPIKAFGEMESRFSNPYRYVTKYYNGQMKISASPGGNIFDPNNYHGVTMVRIKHRKPSGGSMRSKAKFRSLTSNTAWSPSIFH